MTGLPFPLDIMCDAHCNNHCHPIYFGPTADTPIIDSDFSAKITNRAIRRNAHFLLKLYGIDYICMFGILKPFTIARSIGQ